MSAAPELSGDGEAIRPIRLFVPADLGYLRLARVAAATVAASLDFNVQDIEDVRVAVDELAALMVQDAEPGAELELSFATEGDELVAGGVLHGRSDGPAELHSVAAELLGLVVDSYDLHPSDPRSFQVRKRPSGPGE